MGCNAVYFGINLPTFRRYLAAYVTRTIIARLHGVVSAYLVEEVVDGWITM